MKRICLLMMLLLYAFSNAKGQIRFSRFYDYKHTSNLISDVIVLGDTGYFTVSECVDLKSIDTLNFVKTYLYFIRTNQFGDTIYTKAYHKPRYSIDGVNLVKTKWGFLLAGKEFDLKKYQENSLGSYIKLWKVSEFGDTISTRNYDIQNGNDYSVEVIKTKDSGYAIFGQTCNQIQSGKDCDFFLMKLDSNGNKVWHKTYTQNNVSFENPTSIIELPDGSFFLFGYSTISGIMKWFLVKTNNDGNLLWEKVYNEYPRQAGTDIEIVEQSKILLAGSYNSMQNGSGVSKGCVMMVDTTGNKIWSKAFGGIENAGFTNISIDSIKKRILLTGSNGNLDSLKRSQGWLLAISNNGDSLYERLFNPNKIWSEHIYSINKTSNAFLMSGFGVDPNDTIVNQDAWLLKVDSFGCLTPGCQLVGINNIPFSREEIKIYPNPANDKIQFNHSNKIISYRIADYTGKLILAGNYLDSGINVEQLPPGSYIVQVLLEGKVQAFGKLIVTR